MRLEMDEDLKLVAEFMQMNLPAARLVAVASALKAIAPVLWDHYEAETTTAMSPIYDPFSACDPQKQ